MARIPKDLLTRTITPGRVFTVEALVVALLAHIVLFALAGYQPMQKVESEPNSPGISLLTRAEFSEKGWTQLKNWIAVHDPSQISRADSPAGYAALLKFHRTRAVETLRANIPGEEPSLSILPGYVPLLTMEMASIETAPIFGGTLAEPGFSAPAPIREPVIRDGNGAPVVLSGLSVPAVNRPADRPTVIKIWGTPGFMRQHLVESSGVPEFDRAAMQATAGKGFDTARTIVVYWPEIVPGKTGKTEKEKP